MVFVSRHVRLYIPRFGWCCSVTVRLNTITITLFENCVTYEVAYSFTKENKRMTAVSDSMFPRVSSHTGGRYGRYIGKTRSRTNLDSVCSTYSMDKQLSKRCEFGPTIYWRKWSAHPIP